MIQILTEIQYTFRLDYFIFDWPKGLSILTQNDAEGSLQQVRRLNWSVLPSVELSGSYGFRCHSVGMDKGVICICVDQRGWETLFAWVCSEVQVFAVEY